MYGIANFIFKRTLVGLSSKTTFRIENATTATILRKMLEDKVNARILLNAAVFMK